MPWDHLLGEERYPVHENVEALLRRLHPSLTELQRGFAAIKRRRCDERMIVSSKRHHRPRQCKYCGRTPLRGQGICRKCEARPKAENIQIKAVRDAHDWIARFLVQRCISVGNIATLTSFLKIDNAELRELTQLVLDIARVKPHSRRRFRFLKEHHPELLNRILEMPALEWLVDTAYAEGWLPWPDDEEEEFLLGPDDDEELEFDEDDPAPRNFEDNPTDDRELPF